MNLNKTLVNFILTESVSRIILFLLSGYGHLTPRTFGGRLFCMIYAFFGIPVTALMLKSFGKC